MIKTRLLIACSLFTLVSLAQTNVAISPAGVLPTKYADGRALIHAMHNAYAPDKWYRYFTFSQNMEFYRNDSLIKRDVWYEAYRPGSLILKFGTKDSKNGRLYDNYTVHSFKEGAEPTKTPRVHELLLVGLDVYFTDPLQTIKILDSLGYDLTRIREDKFDGRAVYVVGADEGDDKSKQFWIDKERLYMHRIVYDQKGKVNDVVFGDYEKMKGNWIAKTIVFKTDGKLGLIERYYDIKFPKTISEDWFKPEKFNEVVLE
jgi:hypothetical protein